MGYPCVKHYILFYIRGPSILHFFELHIYITKLLKFKIATKRPFLNSLLPKVIQVIG